MFTPNFPWLSPRSAKIVEKYLDSSLIIPVKEYLARPKKEVRAQLVELGYELTGATERNHQALEIMAGILESLHAGSLIVDDVQDSSPERRGHPSFHRIHGVASAINSGNWLYFWAIQQIKTLPISTESRALIVEATLETLFEGHVGQALDIGTPITKVPRHEVPDLCFSAMNSKTGALTGLAVYCGAVIGGINKAAARELFSAGRHFGVLLQIIDDIKNLKFSAGAKADPKRFEDLKNLRPGYIWAFTVEHLPEAALERLKEAVSSLPDLTSFASWCIDFDFFGLAKQEVIKRKNQIIQNFPQAAEPFKKIIDQLENAYEKA